MRTTEFGAVAEVAAGAIGDGVRRIEGVHRAVARRAWRPTGPVGRPSKVVHDLVAAGAYGTVRSAFGMAGALAATALDGAATAGGWRPLSASPGGGAALSVLNGFAGDHLSQAGSELALRMAVRRHERDVAPEPDALAEAFPDAGGHLVVFLHGLMESDRSWRWGGRRYYGDPSVSYGSRLCADLGVTPLYLRYNTGRSVGANGRDLAALLEALHGAWPVPVERMTLIGHSMGGLVIRSACHVGAADHPSWVPLVGDAVYLGTPHLGAPLARHAVAAGSLLARVPEVRPFATFLERPSAGIRDLRHGVLLDEATAGGDSEGWFGDHDRAVPLLPNCRHHAVAASLTSREGSMLDRLAGDLLVQATSATGRGDGRRRVDFLAEEGMAVAGASHLALLNHPTVYEQLLGWLREPRPALGEPAGRPG